MLLLAPRLSLPEARRLGFLAGGLPSCRRRGDRFLVGLRNHLYPLAAGLLEPVPLESADAPEELVVRLTVLLGLVLDQGKFDGAEIIRHLLEAVVGHRGLASTDDPPLKGPCPPSGRAPA